MAARAEMQADPDACGLRGCAWPVRTRSAREVGRLTAACGWSVRRIAAAPAPVSNGLSGLYEAARQFPIRRIFLRQVRPPLARRGRSRRRRHDNPSRTALELPAEFSVPEAARSRSGDASAEVGESAGQRQGYLAASYPKSGKQFSSMARGFLRQLASGSSRPFARRRHDNPSRTAAGASWWRQKFFQPPSVLE